MNALRIDVADLLTHPGARRPVRLESPVDGLGTPAAAVAEPVHLDLVLERISDGIVARGAVRAHWVAECSCCLRELEGDLDLTVGELYEVAPLPGETYPIEGHELDLERLVRDAVLLELPAAPTCETAGLEPCVPVTVPGVTVGVAHPPEVEGDEGDGEAVDPRWAALAELEL